jgi:hypothetical protein
MPAPVLSLISPLLLASVFGCRWTTPSLPKHGTASLHLPPENQVFYPFDPPYQICVQRPSDHRPSPSTKTLSNPPVHASFYSRPTLLLQNLATARKSLFHFLLFPFHYRPPLFCSKNSTCFFTTGSYFSIDRGRCTRGRTIVRK